jgi:hypothetical protein
MADNIITSPDELPEPFDFNTAAERADLDNDSAASADRNSPREAFRNAFTPAQSRHYFRICKLYGSPCGALGAQAIRAMKRLYKAAGKNWFGSAPELTVAGPLETAARRDTRVAA